MLPVVLQPPLPLQSFLPLHPLSPALQPPTPLQSFLPLQSCLAAGSARRTPTLALIAGIARAPALTDALEETGATGAAAMAREDAPASKPLNAAAAIRYFGEFITTAFLRDFPQGKMRETTNVVINFARVHPDIGVRPSGTEY